MNKVFNDKGVEVAEPLKVPIIHQLFSDVDKGYKAAQCLTALKCKIVEVAPNPQNKLGFMMEMEESGRRKKS